MMEGCHHLPELSQQQMGTEQGSLPALGTAGRQHISLPAVLLLPSILLTFSHQNTKHHSSEQGTSMRGDSWRCSSLLGMGCY